ncbi:MAG: hypothetical protein MMC33_004479 [Icmadophila ericetorum]|nr:hypothetical protein [Icmadophila ericetorum]
MYKSTTIATTTTTTTLIDTHDKHHGQAIHAHTNGVMDIDTDMRERDPPPAEQPDVMDTTIDHVETRDFALPSTSSNTASQNTVAETAPSSTSISQGTQTEKWDLLRLGRTAHPPQRPHPTDDLLTLYGLSSLVASVARNDPVTGEKINKMRKSYEGQLKVLDLAGRNKAVKHEEGQRGSLSELTMWPEEEWQNQKVYGKNVTDGLPDSIMKKLERAMKLEKVPMPAQVEEEWKNILGVGHDKQKPDTAHVEPKGKQAVKATVKVTKINGHMKGLKVGTPSAAEVERPKRTGKRRRYDEDSFEGYGEGFVDDEADRASQGGYTSNEGSRKSNPSNKKRKKDRDYTVTTPSMPERTGSYGVGMVGVGSYGR